METEQSEGIQRASAMMQEHGVSFALMPHEISGKTTEQAQAALGISADHLIKTLILVGKRTSASVGVVIQGNRRLDFKKVEALYGKDRLRFATDQEILQITSFPLGGVPAIAVTRCDHCFVDNHLVTVDNVIGAAGTEFCGMQFDPCEMVDKLNLATCDLAKP